MNSEQLAHRIRLHAIDMVNHAHASHIGSILSVADIIAVLYSNILNIKSNDPQWKDRDRLVFSKGHAGVAIYAALAECGFFPIDQLDSYGDDGGIFSCHVSHKNVPGVEVSTGSLGHGCCMACGMALYAKRRNCGYNVYTVIGDGECNEGSVWEMASLAAQQHLNNFTVIIDKNTMQAMGFCKDIIDMEPLSERWKSWGWNVVCVDNGHDHEQLRNAFRAIMVDKCERPKVIIANTIKGKGVSFMENNILWHYRDPQGDFYTQAKKELEGL